LAKILCNFPAVHAHAGRAGFQPLLQVLMRKDQILWGSEYVQKPMGTITVVASPQKRAASAPAFDVRLQPHPVAPAIPKAELFIAAETFHTVP